MAGTRLTEEQARIRAFAEPENDVIRTSWAEEARQKRNKKIKKWLTISCAVVLILLLLLWVFAK